MLRVLGPANVTKAMLGDTKLMFLLLVWPCHKKFQPRQKLAALVLTEVDRGSVRLIKVFVAPLRGGQCNNMELQSEGKSFSYLPFIIIPVHVVSFARGK
jgi:hypothetical protein